MGSQKKIRIGLNFCLLFMWSASFTFSGNYFDLLLLISGHGLNDLLYWQKHTRIWFPTNLILFVSPFFQKRTGFLSAVRDVRDDVGGITMSTRNQRLQLFASFGIRTRSRTLVRRSGSKLDHLANKKSILLFKEHTSLLLKRKNKRGAKFLLDL